MRNAEMKKTRVATIATNEPTLVVVFFFFVSFLLASLAARCIVAVAGRLSRRLFTLHNFKARKAAAIGHACTKVIYDVRIRKKASPIRHTWTRRKT